MGKETKFCVGDKVRVMTDRGSDCLFQGTIGTVKKVSDSIAGLNLLVESYSGCTYWYGSDDLEPVVTVSAICTNNLPIGGSKANVPKGLTHKVTRDDGVVYHIVLEPCTDLV